MSWTDVVVVVLISVGTLFALLAALGVNALPDVFTRMQATTKATTLGIGCILFGVAVAQQEPGTVTKAVSVLLFLFITQPIAAHMIARAAYVTRAPRYKGMLVDEMGDSHRAVEPDEDERPS